MEGNFVACTPKVDKQYTLIAKKIKQCTFNSSTYYSPEHCINNIEVLDIEEGVGLSFDIPDLVQLICDEITVLDPVIIKGFTKPWLSDTNIQIGSPFLPTPFDWMEWLDAEGVVVAWRYGYGEEKITENIPYPDYSGWFLQEKNKIGSTGFGVLFEFVSIVDGKGQISLRKYADCTETIWVAMKKIIGVRAIVIKSGNCTLNGYEWLDYIDNGILPERYQIKLQVHDIG